MNPATPRTSSTATVTARLPLSIAVDNEALWFGALTFEAIIGSSPTKGEVTIRLPSLVSSAKFLNAPCGLDFAGQAISLTSSAAIGTPNASARFATTMEAV